MATEFFGTAVDASASAAQNGGSDQQKQRPTDGYPVPFLPFPTTFASDPSKALSPLRDNHSDYDEIAKACQVPAPYEMKAKDVRMDPLVAVQRPYCPPVHMDSEDNLFILYTSGSTGNPKGLVHTTGGYTLYAKMTTQITFDLAPGDIFACVADCGWITGHTYVVYGPLLNGSTSFMFESTPVYPNVGRYWDMVQRHKITQFYTAPTAIRLLMRSGDEPVKKYDLSSLKVLGSVGEPINPEAWRWYYEVVGKSKCSVVDHFLSLKSTVSRVQLASQSLVTTADW